MLISLATQPLSLLCEVVFFVTACTTAPSRGVRNAGLKYPK